MSAGGGRRALRVLVVTPYYAPDLGPSAPLVTSLCEGLAACGHRVSVLCAVPHLPRGRVAVGFGRRLVATEDRHGVRVRRVWIPGGDRSRLAHRALVYAVYQVLAAILTAREKLDVALVTGPAIETFLPFATATLGRRKPVVYGVWELYPDVGVRLGIFRRAWTVRLVKAAEDRCLRRARAVQSLSRAFVGALTVRGVAPGAITTIEPWVDTDEIRPLPRATGFSTEHGLDGQFVVMHAGTLGYTQGLGVLVESADILRDEPEVAFVFVGDGPERAGLEERARSLRLENVRFVPFQRRERLAEVLASADVAVIHSRKGAGRDLLPSRIFPLLASGRPFVAAVDPSSELERLVEASGAGLCVPPEDPGNLAGAILRLRRDADLRRRLGEQGRAFALRHHSVSAAVEAFEHLLARAAERGA